MSEQTPDSAARAKAWYRAAVGSAVAAGAFSLAVGALVVFHSLENDPAEEFLAIRSGVTSSSPPPSLLTPP